MTKEAKQSAMVTIRHPADDPRNVGGQEIRIQGCMQATDMAMQTLCIRRKVWNYLVAKTWAMAPGNTSSGTTWIELMIDYLREGGELEVMNNQSIKTPFMSRAIAEF